MGHTQQNVFLVTSAAETETCCFQRATDVASDQLCWHTAGRASEQRVSQGRNETNVELSHVISIELDGYLVDKYVDQSIVIHIDLFLLNSWIFAHYDDYISFS